MIQIKLFPFEARPIQNVFSCRFFHTKKNASNEPKFICIYVCYWKKPRLAQVLDNVRNIKAKVKYSTNNKNNYLQIQKIIRSR